MKDSALMAVGIVAFLVMNLAAVVLLIADIIGIVWYLVLLALSLVAMVLPFFKVRGTSATVSDGSLIINAPFVKRDIPLHSIQAVEYRESFAPGMRLWGYGGLKRGYGDFNNKEFGTYTFAGDTSLNGYVVVRHDWGKVMVFNLPDIGETRRIYEVLSGRSADSAAAPPGPVPETTRRGRRKLAIGLAILVIVVPVAIVAITLSAGHVSVSMDDDGISIDATMMDEDIAFEDISSVELRDDVSYGTRVGGYGGMSISSGYFTNSEFGTYRLAIHNDNPLCIVVHKTDGDVIVFNLADEDSTRAFYEEMLERLENVSSTYAHLYLACAA